MEHTNDPLFLPETANALIGLMHAAEKLKCELRHSFTSNRRQESVAEHCWRAALFALVMSPYLRKSCDMSRVIELLIVHDLCEVYAGDVPIFETAEECECKRETEDKAIQRLMEAVPSAVADKIRSLWAEYIDVTTVEAQIAHALDKFEAQLQHNEAPLDTWIEWEKHRVFNGFLKVGSFDQVLSRVREVIVSEAAHKLKTET